MPIYDSSENNKAPAHTSHESAKGVRVNAGPFIGIVKNNVDPMRSGRVQVWIAELGGDPEDPGSWRTVAYASPFFGVTPPAKNPDGPDRRSDGQNFASNPHSYGFWMTPPDRGVSVICTFINGDPFKGYWFACIPDWPNMHMVPAIGTNSQSNGDPAIEYNDEKKDDSSPSNIAEFYERQATPHDEIKKQFQKQGLGQDKERGPITSSAFRESPSAVFGFSTPGQLINPAAATDPKVSDTGRKGGHTFVMDDGDAETQSSQLIRLRSATGHQLTMHDTGGFIYITNAAGTAWVELDQGGNINMYADAQFNLKSKGPMQIESDAGVKIHGKTGVDINSEAKVAVSGKGGLDLSSDADAKLSGKKNLHLKGSNTYLTGDKCIQVSGGVHLDLGAACINLNCSKPTKAKDASPAQAPQGMPTKEPWSGHKKGGNSGSSKGGGAASGGGISGGYGKNSGYNGSSGSSPGGGGAASGGGSNYGSSSNSSSNIPSGGNTSGGSNVTLNPSGGDNGFKGYPDLVANRTVVGNGQCVMLVYHNSDCGTTNTWRPASNNNLFDNPPAPGAAIATMPNGYYPNMPSGNHAAIYLGQGEDARGKYITVQEQNVPPAMGSQYRNIYANDAKSMSNNANAYRVIANDRNPNGVYVRGATPPQTQKQNPPQSDAKLDKPYDNTDDKGFHKPADEAKAREEARKAEEDKAKTADQKVEEAKVDQAKAQEQINNNNAIKEKSQAMLEEEKKLPEEMQDKEKIAALEKSVSDADARNASATQALTDAQNRENTYIAQRDDYRSASSASDQIMGDGNTPADRAAVAERDSSQNSVAKEGFDETTGQPYTYYESPKTNPDRDIEYDKAAQDQRIQDASSYDTQIGQVEAPQKYILDDQGNRINAAPDVVDQNGYAQRAESNPTGSSGGTEYSSSKESWSQDNNGVKTSGSSTNGVPDNPVTANNANTPGAGGAGTPGAPANNQPAAAGGPSC